MAGCSVERREGIKGCWFRVCFAVKSISLKDPRSSTATRITLWKLGTRLFSHLRRRDEARNDFYRGYSTSVDTSLHAFPFLHLRVTCNSLFNLRKSIRMRYLLFREPRIFMQFFVGKGTAWSSSLRARVTPSASSGRFENDVADRRLEIEWVANDRAASPQELTRLSVFRCENSRGCRADALSRGFLPPLARRGHGQRKRFLSSWHDGKLARRSPDVCSSRE